MPPDDTRLASPSPSALLHPSKAAQPDSTPAEQVAGIPRSDDTIARHEARNFLVLMLNQIVLRSGWIFKTETVIVPAFLDTLVGGAGWMRGLLPVLNRFGQSVPPLFYSPRLAAAPRKKWPLVRSSLVMGVPWLVLAYILHQLNGQSYVWLAPLFLLIYTLFGVSNGINQISYNTVQGKLIQPARRGRLLAASAFLGAISAIGLTWWFLGGWLEQPDGGFDAVFAFCGGVFVISGVTAMFVREPRDEAAPRSVSRPGGSLGDAWRLLRDDANFRRLVEMVVLVSTILILFPHFQAFARVQLGLAGRHMMVWVIAQNAALGVYSLLIGPLADRFGNRLALRVIAFTLAGTPVLAVALAHVTPSLAAKFYPCVFAMLGLTPVLMRTLQNYTLEICRTADHPRYLGTLSFCLAVPFLLSPLVGWAIDLAGFEPVFLAGAVLLLCAGLVTFRLVEPRRHGFRPAELATPIED